MPPEIAYIAQCLAEAPPDDGCTGMFKTAAQSKGSCKFMTAGVNRLVSLSLGLAVLP